MNKAKIEIHDAQEYSVNEIYAKLSSNPRGLTG
jgi:hypothetical protein